MQDIIRVSVDLTKPEVTFSTTWYSVLLVISVIAALLVLRWRIWRKVYPRQSMPMRSVKVKLRLPGTEVDCTWEPDESERRAAWELYVELVTRTTVVELKDDEGLLREALSSFYSLFETTRRILRQYGPSIAIPKSGGQISFGQLAVLVLNQVLRPVLSTWHPRLMAWESQRKKDVSPAEHERAWEHNQELRKAVREARKMLMEYAKILEDVAQVPSLIQR